MNGAGTLPAEAQRQLIEVARGSIEAHLAARPFAGDGDDGRPAHPELREKRGAFVTLRRREDRRLRGCVGRVEAELPLVQTVARVAVSAATADSRFPPVTLDELGDLSLEISALSRPQPVKPEEVVVGRHGLIVSYAGRSGLLLPQVALEYGWEREAFLQWVCRKAGLPIDAWRQPGCELLGFTATVFGEDDPPTSR